MEGIVAEHELADTHGDIAIVAQADARLLRSQVHHHDAQLHRGHGLLLGAEAGGQLIAVEIDPSPQHGREAALPDGLEEIGPVGFFAEAAPREEIPFVVGAKTAADDAGAGGQAEVIIEEDLLDADRLQLA